MYKVIVETVAIRDDLDKHLIDQIESAGWKFDKYNFGKFEFISPRNGSLAYLVSLGILDGWDTGELQHGDIIVSATSSTGAIVNADRAVNNFDDAVNRMHRIVSSIPQLMDNIQVNKNLVGMSSTNVSLYDPSNEDVSIGLKLVFNADNDQFEIVVTGGDWTEPDFSVQVPINNQRQIIAAVAKKVMGNQLV